MKRKKQSDDFDLLIEEVYKFTDRVIGTLNRIYISHFNELKSISYTELNRMNSAKTVYQKVNQVYEVVEKKTEEYYLLLAQKVYKTVSEFFDFELVMDFLTMDWIIAELMKYDPVTKYLYFQEIDRKKSRLAEAIISSETTVKEVDNGVRIWSNQAKQYADKIVKTAIEQVYEDNGIKYVEWRTEGDARVCPECDKLEGKVFKQEEAPNLVHYGCRCYTVPVEETNVTDKGTRGED